MRYPSPGPLARATLSRWERDLPECFFHFAGRVAHSDGIKENHFDLTTTPAFGPPPVPGGESLLLPFQFIHTFISRLYSFTSETDSQIISIDQWRKRGQTRQAAFSLLQ